MYSYYSRPRRRDSAALFFRKGQVVKEVILTPEGHKKLQEEIEYLSNDKRREVADRIRIAREFGDIAENAEYDDAKNEQALLEHRIAMLEERLRDAKVINKKDVAKDVVSVGSKVKQKSTRLNSSHQIISYAVFCLKKKKKKNDMKPKNTN